MPGLPVFSDVGPSKAEEWLKGDNAGCEEDLYVPRPKNWQYQSPVWHFARKRYTDDLLFESKKIPKPRAWCLLTPCPTGGIIQGKLPAIISQHLERHHALTVAEQRRQHRRLCNCGCDGVPHAGSMGTTLARETKRSFAQACAKEKHARTRKGDLVSTLSVLVATPLNLPPDTQDRLSKSPRRARSEIKR